MLKIICTASMFAELVRACDKALCFNCILNSACNGGEALPDHKPGVENIIGRVYCESERVKANENN